MHLAPNIYEAQCAPPQRTCGAAALCMAYRSLGLEQSQAEIWKRVSRRPGALGAVRTFSLAADALAQGLASVVVQARHPWSFLQQCADAGVRVILNHRLAAEVPCGHFSLLAGIDDQSVWLHDPQLGPFRWLPKEEMLSLWQGRLGRAEIAGNVAVAIAAAQAAENPCSDCGQRLPIATNCPNCAAKIPLDPAPALGCTNDECQRRQWERVFCPRCDWSLRRVELRLDN